MGPHQAIERIKPCLCVISDGKQQSSNVFTYRDVWMTLITTHFFSPVICIALDFAGSL